MQPSGDGLSEHLRALERRLAIELERFGRQQALGPELFPGVVIHASEAARALEELHDHRGDPGIDADYLRAPCSDARASQARGLADKTSDASLGVE
ncbi:hypothetical protein DB30_00052 [Enhygromyxa salina]|uniref:Uncharacterized protein n=1 Tax=Enhygromyxa salina TaxID=215803 RepID=A0A0C2A7J9_9BACT|nr:hypothetical protein DB30_00052 [Enhygromyxa salina]